MFQGIAWKQMFHRLGKQFLQGDIQRADRPMKIDRAEQIRPRFDEIDQRGQSPHVNGQALRREETVMQQAG